jgi:phosphatidate cytidylyltransferase
VTRERLFGSSHAFDHPVSLWITVAVAGTLVFAMLVIAVLSITRAIGPELRRELVLRTRSWGIMAPLLLGPVLLGAAPTILAVLVLSLLCFREYARATGLFRERVLCLVIALGILLVYFAVLDHWYGLYVALFPLATGTIAVATIPLDRPQGYIQRVALAIFGFMLFGCSLSHLAYMANDRNYRPIVLLLLLAVALNDVFAYVVGKTLGRRKLAPHTSPNKTWGGSLGAAVLTTALVVLLGRPVFRGTVLDAVLPMAGLGLIVSAVGQLGDLMLSSVKRDLGIKDIGAVIPGHGGILDRFNSLLFVAPAAFHYVGYFIGFGLDQPTRIITGP